MGYSFSDIEAMVSRQRAFFRTGATLDVKWRIQQLKKLKRAVIAHGQKFTDALPVVTFPDSAIDRLMATMAEREHPLAMYLFTNDIRWAKRVMRTHQYGGGCINEVCIHLMVKGVPFNGTGHSGMGAYHGEWGFREFTHPCTVLIGKTRFNLPLREHPYNNKLKMKLLRWFEK